MGDAGQLVGPGQDPSDAIGGSFRWFLTLTKDALASPAREPPPIFNYEWDTPLKTPTYR